MGVLYGGAVYYKTDIVFNDNTFDLKSAHPVLVLYTTDMNDENAYVLQMTSDKRRARKNENMYTPITYAKKSFLNLSHIIETPNNIRDNYELININEYERVLREFYKYQKENKSDEKFNIIKDRIEIILKMLECSPEDNITKEFLVNNTNLQKYLINNKIMKNSTKEQTIKAIVEIRENKEDYDVGSENLKKALLTEFKQFDTYIQQNEWLEKSDFRDNSSKDYIKFKKYYANLQSKYPLVNVDQLLLAQVAMDYRDDTSQSKLSKLKNIEEFVEEEMERRKQEIKIKNQTENEKKLKKTQKYEEKAKRKKEERMKKYNKKRADKRKRDEKKYGKFYEFY